MLSSLELIASESRRCGEIVKNLLTFARVAPMNLQWVQVNGVIEQCAKLVEHQCELKGIELHKQIDLLLPKMHGDPAQIEQLLLALVVNAIEAMPHGGNLWLGAGQQDASISLSVRDDGIGIPPDLLPYIFEPFRTTKEGHSAGLGLAVSSSIVERHHGRIKVDSEPGRGTTFTILLPLDANVPATATAAALAVAR
jgi:two-component system NtrC family sensor kinase